MAAAQMPLPVVTDVPAQTIYKIYLTEHGNDPLKAAHAIAHRMLQQPLAYAYTEALAALTREALARR